MKSTQADLKASILLLAGTISGSHQRGYEVQLEQDSLPSVVKNLVYDLFVKGFNSYFEKDDDVFEAWTRVHEYTRELSAKGYVSFGE